jgi:hypothetical protein
MQVVQLVVGEGFYFWWMTAQIIICGLGAHCGVHVSVVDYGVIGGCLLRYDNFLLN